MNMRKITAENMTDIVTKHLNTDVVTLRPTDTVGQALAQLRLRDINDKIAYLYVTGDSRQLVGVVPVRRLLGSEPNASIESIMLPSVVSIPDTSSVLEACEELLNRRLLALPVVDSQGAMLGVIDLNLFTDEVLTAAKQQMDSAFQLIGVHVALGRRVSSWRSFRDRFPWLLCNIASGIACAFVASRFTDVLRDWVLLSMFLTVVLALGESVSMQSMTITVQGLLARKLSWRQVFVSARKELATSIMLGVGCGGIIGLTALLWHRQPVAGIALGSSICLSIVTASFLGVAIPTTIHKLKIDPKVAAGPIVLAMADVATLLFYFNIAQWLLM